MLGLHFAHGRYDRRFGRTSAAIDGTVAVMTMEKARPYHRSASPVRS